MMSKQEMVELRARAKKLGINSFGISKVALTAALAALDPLSQTVSDSPVVNPREMRPATRDETGRKERIPLGTPSAKMSAPVRPGYNRRWINDAGDRLRRAEAAAYQFVEDEGERDESGRGARVSMTVGTKEDGSPLTAYLMEIRNEFYEADQVVKQRQIQETDAAIQRGDVSGAQAQDRDKFYVPDEGISVGS